MISHSLKNDLHKKLLIHTLTIGMHAVFAQILFLPNMHKHTYCIGSNIFPQFLRDCELQAVALIFG